MLYLRQTAVSALAALALFGIGPVAHASEVFTFSGYGSFLTQGNGSTGGAYGFSFTSNDPVQTSATDQRIYNLTGSVTLTPYAPSVSNPVVEAGLADTFALVLTKDPGRPFYAVQLFDTTHCCSVIFTKQSGPGDIGALDLNSPGQVSGGADSVTTGNLDFISGNGGYYGNIIAPTGGFTFTISDPTPEPAQWALMMVAVGGLGAALRRRDRTAGQTA